MGKTLRLMRRNSIPGWKSIAPSIASWRRLTTRCPDIKNTPNLILNAILLYLLLRHVNANSHLLSFLFFFFFFAFCNYLFSESIYARVENKKLLCDAKCYRGIPHSAAICRTTAPCFRLLRTLLAAISCTVFFVAKKKLRK